MVVDGWAYTENENNGQKLNIAEAAKFSLNNKSSYVIVESVTEGYAHIKYIGHLKNNHPKINLKELLIYLDDGNLCFGGRGYIQANGHFEAIVHTD